jgi:hypothetical protein
MALGILRHSRHSSCGESSAKAKQRLRSHLRMSLDVSALEGCEHPVASGCLSSQIVHGCGDARSLSRWLAALDDFRNWLRLGLEARERE